MRQPGRCRIGIQTARENPAKVGGQRDHDHARKWHCAGQDRESLAGDLGELPVDAQHLPQEVDPVDCEAEQLTLS
ncbi:MAG TPA: hypothetical protein VE476_12170 [Propionibacteriaceae bacterium]|nr:hypothetical protein [Propionibacteriaceae bacterium]